jgi:hypothetical protein
MQSVNVIGKCLKTMYAMFSNKKKRKSKPWNDKQCPQHTTQKTKNRTTYEHHSKPISA